MKFLPENLVDGEYYWLKFPSGEETIGEWIGHHFMIIGSDEYIHLNEVHEIYRVCPFKH